MANTSLEDRLKRIPVLHRMGRFIRQRSIDAKAICRFLLARARRHRQSVIKVGFLCQYTPSWPKLESLYHQMCNDPRFEPYLLCVPSNISEYPQNNDTYEYFQSLGYPEAINTLLGNGNWLDLASLGLSYVFYTRPYNALMPAPYASAKVSTHSRICLILYGMPFSEEDMLVALNRDFLANTYFFFADSKMAAKYNIDNNKLAHRLKLQKTLCLGMPAMESMLKKRSITSPSWDFSQSNFRVMWTPRWTTDPTIGGTNFFTYYQSLLAFAREHSDMDFLFRPHPLAFQHFIESGKMIPQQVDQFKAACEAQPNVSLDRQSEYDATIWGSDVLISDISGIIPEYLLTGKPLIFCATNMQLTLTEDFDKLLEACYVVYSEEELYSCLLALQSGDDPLQEKRQQIVRDLFGDVSIKPSTNILEAIAKDAQK